MNMGGDRAISFSMNGVKSGGTEVPSLKRGRGVEHKALESTIAPDGTDIQHLAVCTALMCDHMDQRVRELEAATWTAFNIASNHECIQAALTGKRERQKELDKSDNKGNTATARANRARIGSPQVWAAARAMEVFSRTLGTGKEEALGALQQMVARVSQDGPISLEEYVKQFTVKVTTKDKDKATVHFRLTNGILHEEFMEYLLATGGKVLSGTAPPGYHSHKVREALGDHWTNRFADLQLGGT